MGLDDRLAALAAAVREDDADGGPNPADVEVALGATRARAGRGRGRARAVLAVAAVLVLVAGVALAVQALGGDDGPEQLHAGPSGPSTSTSAPPAVDAAAPHLWLSATDIPTAGADVAVQLVDPTRAGDTYGVAAQVERWDGERWVDPVHAALCTDFWGCTGEIGGSGAVPDIGLSAESGRGPLTWLRVEGLEPGWYRLSQTANEGTVATASFRVGDDAAAQPPSDVTGNAHLGVEPAVRTTAMSSTMATVRLVVHEVTTGIPVPERWQDGVVRVERWEDGGWGTGFVGDGLQLTPSTDPDQPDAYTVDLGPWPPGTYRLAIGTDDVTATPTLEGRFWVVDETGGTHSTTDTTAVAKTTTSTSTTGTASKPAGATSTDRSALDRQWADSLGIDVGDRVLVGSDDGKNQTGYINWDAGQPFLPPDAPPVVPVYDTGGPSGNAGTVIAYWGHGVGWITLEQYHDPSFDYEALRAEHESAAATTTAKPGG